MRELKGVPGSASGLERTANEGSFVRCAVHKLADAQLLEQASDGGPRFHWHVSVSVEDETFPSGKSFFSFEYIQGTSSSSFWPMSVSAEKQPSLTICGIAKRQTGCLCPTHEVPQETAARCSAASRSNIRRLSSHSARVQRSPRSFFVSDSLGYL